MKTITKVILATSCIILLDQASKWFIRHYYPADFICNNGMCFGIAQTSSMHGYVLQTALISISIAIAIWYSYISYRNTMSIIPYALLIGGGISNIIDRCTLGFVVDFISFRIKCGPWIYFWPWFNIADIAIVSGILLILYTSRTKK
jgi:signal peptidase II